MSEYYSKNLAREVMKGMKETAYQCRHTGGIASLGYDVGEDKRYIINEQEAKCVRLIFGRNSLHSILTNEKYTGVYVYNKSAKKDAFGRRNNHSFKDPEEEIRIDGGMQAIISKEDFQKASEIINRRKKRPGANKAKENYLLSGLMKCGECGYSNARKQATSKRQATICII